MVYSDFPVVAETVVQSLPSGSQCDMRQSLPLAGATTCVADSFECHLGTNRALQFV